MKIKPSVIILTILVLLVLLVQLYFLSGLPSVYDFSLCLIDMTVKNFWYNSIPALRLEFQSDGNPGIYFFAIECFTVIITFYLLLIKQNLRKESHRPGLGDLIQVCLVIMILVTTLRTSAQFFLAFDFMKFYGGMTPDERLDEDYPAVYQFNHILSGSGRAKVLSGYDGPEDLQFQMQLAYFLYPIDIRGVHPGEPQVYIIFNKDNARFFVPDGFRVVRQMDARTLIAVRKTESGG